MSHMHVTYVKSCSKVQRNVRHTRKYMKDNRPYECYLCENKFIEKKEKKVIKTDTNTEFMGGQITPVKSVKVKVAEVYVKFTQVIYMTKSSYMTAITGKITQIMDYL